MLGLPFSSKLNWDSYPASCQYCLQENWNLDLFYDVSFSWSCFLYYKGSLANQCWNGNGHCDVLGMGWGWGGLA